MRVFFLSYICIMNVDYLIVGCGLAGISFAEVLFQNNKSFVVINDNSQNSTKIAGGLYNPVVLKRFTESWQANRQVKLMYDFYRKVEEKLDCKLFNEDIPVEKGEPNPETVAGTPAELAPQPEVLGTSTTSTAPTLVDTGTQTWPYILIGILIILESVTLFKFTSDIN